MQKPNDVSWINQDVVLEGSMVKLLPLEPVHFKELYEVSNVKDIWEHYVFDGTNYERFMSRLEDAMVEKVKGSQFPFVIISKKENKIVGSTRFMDIQIPHKKLEIGTTWIHPDHWGSGLNVECKFLLLQYSFETLEAVRLQLKTDEHNLRSRKAIEKIGGVFEGILRNDMIRENGTLRNSAYFSIVSEEWPQVKAMLIQQMSVYSVADILNKDN